MSLPPFFFTFFIDVSRLFGSNGSMSSLFRSKFFSSSLVAICLGISWALPVQKESPSSALYYFMQYGYIEGSSGTAALLDQRGLEESIKKFQVFAGLNVTGVLDDETIELMNTPRCGVKDFVGYGSNARRKKRYLLQGSKWKLKGLKYKISKYPSKSKYSKREIDEEIRAAFDVWEKVTDLKFVKQDYGRVHIEIIFDRRKHGDNDPFDGPGGTLAHAFFPHFGGDAHFDDEEFWTIRELRGTNLLQAAAHEFGHSLGLSHSDVKSALMAPFYRGYNPNFKLNGDDERAIQALYGKKPDSKTLTSITTTTRRPWKTPSSQNSPDLCRDSSIDAIFQTADGNDYVFKDSWYWKLTDDSIEEGYPQKIENDWPGLPAEGIDAAFSWTNNLTYIFKGSYYWKFQNRIPQKGYPRSISNGFEGIPNNVDAAFVWGGNGRIYFFKGGDYYRFDPDKKPPVSWRYPQKVSNWGFRRATAALRWKNGFTYFFMSDGTYYRFNDRKFAIDKTDPPFPRNTGTWWFGCKANSNLDDRHYVYSSLRKSDNDILDIFDEKGDEMLDVLSPHEY